LTRTILIFLLLLSESLLAQKSLFSTGKWFKIKIQSDQVYTLNSSFFKKNNIEVSSIDPRNIHVFSGQIGMLPQANKAPKIDHLVELPVFCNDDNGKFETKDFIKFYGAGPHVKQYNGRFSTLINTYSYEAFFYILIDDIPSKKIEVLSEVFAGAEQINRAEIYEYEEKELKNILASGRQWFGDFFYDKFNFKRTLRSPTSPIQCQVAIMGVGRLDQKLNIFNNSEKIYTDVLSKSSYNSTDTYDRYNRYSNVDFIEFKLPSTSIDFEFKLATEGSANSGAYVDFIRYNYTTKLSALSKTITEYWVLAEKRQQANLKIEGLNQNFSVWNVSNSYSSTLYKASAEGLIGIRFNDLASRILIVDDTAPIFPVEIKPLKNSNLFVSEVPEMLIVYPLKFKAEAEKLAIHKRKDKNLIAQAICTDDIYDTFSSGKVDPSAIRDFCKYLWNKNSKTFKFLLLFGDASFDYKNANNASFVKTQDMIPSYQSYESLEPIYSYCSDDYFGFLEDSEGLWEEGFSKDDFWVSNTANDHTLDIAIGRLPVKNVAEAQQIVNKIIKNAEKPASKWPAKFTMVADNRDYNIHTDNAENLSAILKNQFGGLEISKLYIDAFEVNKAIEAPAATNTLIENLNQGTFLINYAGHGSESGWAQEKLLTLKDILAFKNSNWPVFFTATCQFGKFDNPGLTSGAELALLQPDAGAIAFLTTTRPVYASTNEKINQAFFKNIRKYKTLGELFSATKNASQAGEVNRNFTLLGDPSLELPTFEESIVLEKINAKVVQNPTLRSQETIQLSGKVAGLSTGKIFIEVFDKPLTLKTKGAFPDEKVFEFQNQNTILYRGEAEVNNGEFSFSIILPKNQISGTGKGLMRFSAQNIDKTMSRMGFFDDFLISSENPSAAFTQPPSINYTLNPNSEISIAAIDDRGVFSGNGFNELVIDDSIKIALNPIANFTDLSKNMLSNVNLSFLGPGKHKLSIFIYDVDNNKTTKTFDLQISKPVFEIQNVVIYPNPIEDFTYIILQHNRPQEDLIANCTLFDLNGRILKNIEKNCNKCNAKWDFGLDFEEINSGGHEIIYKIELISRSDLSKTSTTGRLLVLK
jgi:Peptidase family C25